MVYKFVMISDEVSDFRREIYINSDATFKELHDIILKCVDYDDSQMTSFQICDDDWSVLNEVTQIEMDTTSDTDSYVMDKTYLDEFVEEKGQKLIFVFDPFSDRAFFMELKDVKLNETLDKAVCKVKKGKAPVQLQDSFFTEDLDAMAKGGADLTDFEDFDDQGFDDEELGDLSINEGEDLF